MHIKMKKKNMLYILEKIFKKKLLPSILISDVRPSKDIEEIYKLLLKKSNNEITFSLSNGRYLQIDRSKVSNVNYNLIFYIFSFHVYVYNVCLLSLNFNQYRGVEQSGSSSGS